MSDLKTAKKKISNLKKSIKAAELRLETAETDEDRKRHETTLKTLHTKLENAKKSYAQSKVERNAELKEKFGTGVKSIGTKTGIAITGTVLIIAAAIGYEYLRKDEDDMATASSDNV